MLGLQNTIFGKLGGTDAQGTPKMQLMNQMMGSNPLMGGGQPQPAPSTTNNYYGQPSAPLPGPAAPKQELANQMVATGNTPQPVNPEHAQVAINALVQQGYMGGDRQKITQIVYQKMSDPQFAAQVRQQQQGGGMGGGMGGMV